MTTKGFKIEAITIAVVVLLLVVVFPAMGISYDATAENTTDVPEENQFTPSSQTTIIRDRSYATTFTVVLPEDDVDRMQVRFYKLHENQTTLHYTAYTGENEKIHVGLAHNSTYRVEVDADNLNETKTVEQFIPSRKDTTVRLVFR